MNITAVFRTILLIAVAWTATQWNSTCNAQASCDGCQGQCHYCVDGQCIPRRHTYGHYQTHWRRWPVPPPALPMTDSMLGSSIGDADVDLPAIEDEGEGNPDLSHRRERAGNLPAVEVPMDDGLNIEPNTDPFEDEDAEQVPRPADESTSRNMPRSFPVDRTQYARLNQPLIGNPLRTTLPAISETIPVGFDQPISRPAPITQPYYANPLR